MDIDSQGRSLQDVCQLAQSRKGHQRPEQMDGTYHPMFPPHSREEPSVSLTVFRAKAYRATIMSILWLQTTHRSCRDESSPPKWPWRPTFAHLLLALCWREVLLTPPIPDKGSQGAQ